MTDGVALVPPFMAQLLTHFPALAQAFAMPRMADVMASETRVAPRPIVPAMVERAVPVVPRPVGVDRERDDRDVDLRRVDRKQHAAVMVKKFEKAGVDPAAVARPADVTPVIVADAAVNVHVRSVWNRGYHWKFGGRAGAHVNAADGKTCPRHGRGRCAYGNRQSGGSRNQNVFHRFSPFFRSYEWL
ncbi:MAG TPA: hypothetical protein VFL51_01860 [Pseudolabrys sp.]|nr:hypothetical protein [Pseudolabrys sp.]